MGAMIKQTQSRGGRGGWFWAMLSVGVLSGACGSDSSAVKTLVTPHDGGAGTQGTEGYSPVDAMTPATPPSDDPDGSTPPEVLNPHPGRVWKAGRNDICVLDDQGEIICTGVGAQKPPPGPFADFDLDEESSGCAVDPSGNIACWGENPAALSPPAQLATAITIGDDFACGLDVMGEIFCWGPGNAALNLPSGVYVQLDSTQSVACARQASGEVQCWGGLSPEFGMPPSPPTPLTTISLFDGGACGIDTTGEALCWTGTSDSAPAGPHRAIHAGRAGACAVSTNGVLRCWGQEANEVVQPEDSWLDVRRSLFVTCGENYAEEIRCWGNAFSGQANAPSETFRTLAAGSEATCALDDQGAVSCWGRDVDSALSLAQGTGWAEVDTTGFATCLIDSLGATTCHGRSKLLTPPSIPLHGIDIAANHACALTSDNLPVCWGDPLDGQADVPPDAPPMDRIATGYINTCGIESGTGSLICWGSANNNALSPPSGSFHEVSLGGAHFCALEDVTDAIRCWGTEYEGRLAAPSGAFVDLDIDGSHGCAIDVAGAIHCWGTNGYGESEPPAGSFVQVRVGSYHGCALDTEGRVQCWGVDDTPFD